MIGIVTESLSCMTTEDRIFDNCVIVPAYCVRDNKILPDSVREYPYGSKSITTRSPSATDYFNAFKELSKTTNEIVCLTTSAKLISSYENAMIAAKACRSFKVEVIDTGSTAGAMHMLIKLCRALEGIGVGYSDIIKILRQQRKNIVTTFTVKNVHSIRASNKSGAIRFECPMPILNQRPIFYFEPDGSISMKKNASGNLNMEKELLEPHRKHFPRRIALYYSDVTTPVRELIREIKESFPDADVMSRRVSHAIRANTGEHLI
ncbi:MAG: DegV family protein, partial [Clostridia bacterium]|nr:DegV family protein [Clostridia bacterium]